MAPWNKTCPRFYALKPAVLSVLEDVEDYKRGALGNVNTDLAAPEVDLLRTAEREHAAWESENLKQQNG